MHVALLANTAWLDEELATLKHLVVGLLDEQIRVTEVVPERLSVEETGDLIERIAWNESRWPTLNHERVIRLQERLRMLDVDLLHAMDGRLWRSTASLAERMNLPAVFSASSYLDMRPAKLLAKRINPQRVAFTAATEPIAQGLREHLGTNILVQTIGHGVYPTTGRTDAFTSKSLCAIVAGNGVLDANYQSLLEGIVDFLAIQSEAQFFFDGQDSDQHQLWKAASRLGLLANLSLIPRRLGHRELLLRADVLIQPQALGKARSLTLMAMAHGLPILAHEDYWLDYLIDNQTAWLVTHPTAETWARSLQRVVNDKSQANELGQRARKWVIAQHSASKQVRGVLDTYRRLTGKTLKFPGDQ